MKKFTLITLAVALAAFAVGCTSTANTNVKVNGANVNSNTAAVVNSNQAPITNMNAAMNTNTMTNKSLTREEYDKDKDKYATEAKTAKDTVGSGLNDGYLWAKAKGALALVDGLRDSTINVDINNAVITLRGSVATQAQKDQAATAVKVDGVTSVTNNLTVKPNDSMTKQMTGASDADGGKKGNMNK